MADTVAQWVEHDPKPEPAPQTLLPFLDPSDTITTSQAARLLEMSSENVRVLAREEILEVRASIGGERLYSRRQVLKVKSKRDVHAILTNQRKHRLRMPYAAYRSR